MKCLIYLMRTTLKNRLKDLIHHPAKLVFVLLMAALLVFVFITSDTSSMLMSGFRDRKELFAIVFLFYGIMFVMNSLRGLSAGASFYTMADVHLLFSAPLSSVTILFYGLIRQAGTSLLMGFFMLFQYSWLHQLYGISMGGLLVILIGYAICIFCSQLLAMAIYSFTSSDERVQKIVRGSIYGVSALAAGYILYPVFRGAELMTAAAGQIDSLPIRLFPVAGWTQYGIVGLMEGSAVSALLGIGSCALFAVLVLVVLMRARADYYEDVLQATEVSFSAVTARKEGKAAEIAPRNIKTGKTGIGKGRGATVFFYKHMLENRRGRLFLLDTNSLIFIGMVALLAYFMRDMGVFFLFIFATYLQIFNIASGRWGRELMLPYVYMIPEKPFVKLYNMCKESFLKCVVEAVAMFLVVGVVMGLSWGETVGCIIGRIGFGILFVAGNILIQRLFGSLESKVLVLMFYFIVMILLCAPGAIVGFVLLLFFPETGLLSMFLAIFIWNTGMATLIFCLCRNILDYSELNNR